MEHLYYLYYTYFPRFMTEDYEFRHDDAQGNPPNWDEPPRPGDYLVIVEFFNFFGRPIFVTETRYEAKT